MGLALEAPATKESVASFGLMLITSGIYKSMLRQQPYLWSMFLPLQLDRMTVALLKVGLSYSP